MSPGWNRRRVKNSQPHRYWGFHSARCLLPTSTSTLSSPVVRLLSYYTWTKEKTHVTNCYSWVEGKTKQELNYMCPFCSLHAAELAQTKTRCCLMMLLPSYLSNTVSLKLTFHNFNLHDICMPTIKSLRRLLGTSWPRQPHDTQPRQPIAKLA